MPMNWNSDADARLLVGIVNFTDFKLNKETLAKLNEWMGPDCVGQSISQRLIKLKKKFYEDHPELVGATISGSSSAQADATPKTPKSTSKSTKRKKVDDDDEAADEDAPATPALKKRGGGRPKKNDDTVKTETPGTTGDGAPVVTSTLTPKKRGRPSKADVAAKLSKSTEEAGNNLIKKEPGSGTEDNRADSVIQSNGITDQLIAATVQHEDTIGDDADHEPSLPAPDSDDEA